jgi:hypothetical protein
MLDVIATVLVGLGIAVILTALTGTVLLRLPGRLVLTGAAGVWIGPAGAVAGAGALSNPQTVLAMFGAPLVAAVVIALFSPMARHAFGAVPVPVRVGLNVIRRGGVLFVLLAIAGRLSGPFPDIAGWATS